MSDAPGLKELEDALDIIEKHAEDVDDPADRREVEQIAVDWGCYVHYRKAMAGQEVPTYV